MKTLLFLLIPVLVLAQYNDNTTHYFLETYQVNEGYEIPTTHTAQVGDTLQAEFTLSHDNPPPYDFPYTHFHKKTDIYLNTPELWVDSTAYISFIIDYPPGIYEYVVNAYRITETDTTIAYCADAMYILVEDSTTTSVPDMGFFETYVVDNHVTLKWKVSKSSNVAWFNIYKDNQLFTSPSYNPGQLYYTLEDKDVTPGRTYSYTIEFISPDGQLTQQGTSRITVPMISGITLAQNYPNPFNPSTTIEYSIDDRADVQIIIYSVQGIEAKKINQGIQSPGHYSLILTGDSLASGTYFYFLRVHNIRNHSIQMLSKKMVLLK